MLCLDILCTYIIKERYKLRNSQICPIGTTSAVKYIIMKSLETFVK